MLKLNIIFHDSTKTILFSKHLNDSEVLVSNSPDLRTSAASMTSTASVAYMIWPLQRSIFFLTLRWILIYVLPRSLVHLLWADPYESAQIKFFVNSLHILSKTLMILIVGSSLSPKWTILVLSCGRNHQKTQIFTDIWTLSWYFFENRLMKFKCPNLLKPLGTII